MMREIENEDNAKKIISLLYFSISLVKDERCEVSNNYTEIYVN